MGAAPYRKGQVLHSVVAAAPSLTATDEGYIGITNSTSYCTVALDTAADGHIECTAKGGNAGKFNGKTITLNRTADGAWSCASNLDLKYKPGKCS
ncbi:hypothetical protein GFL47_12805 [Pseudomonas stutzeri]|nr:hypothetical protein [Stutzerimonas frequens]